MNLSYQHFNSGVDQLTYDANIAEDLRNWVAYYNQRSEQEYLHIEQETGRFRLYRESDCGFDRTVFLTNDHNWFAKYIKTYYTI